MSVSFDVTSTSATGMAVNSVGGKAEDRCAQLVMLWQSPLMTSIPRYETSTGWTTIQVVEVGVRKLNGLKLNARGRWRNDTTMPRMFQAPLLEVVVTGNILSTFPRTPSSVPDHRRTKAIVDVGCVQPYLLPILVFTATMSTGPSPED